jgi:hypothetical protein
MNVLERSERLKILTEFDARTIIASFECIHGNLILGALSTSQITLLQKINKLYPDLNIESEMYFKYVNPASEVAKFNLKV